MVPVPATPETTLKRKRGCADLLLIGCPGLLFLAVAMYALVKWLE